MQLYYQYGHRHMLCAVCYVYNDLLSCVCCFLLPRPFLAPTEQLVLTTIRQEASEQQDPGSGATMRARLTDRFDKSEFAQIGLDDLCLESQGACVMRSS